MGYSRDKKIKNKNKNDMTFRKKFVKYQLNSINNNENINNTDIGKFKIDKNIIENNFE